MPKESLKSFSFFRGKLHFTQPSSHRVSVDLVLFLAFIGNIRKNYKVIDLGSGFGFLSVCLAKKYPFAKIVALEKDPQMVKLLEENIFKNDIHSIEVVAEDIKNVSRIFERGSFNVALANPPFFPKNYGGENPYHFEDSATLEDFIYASSYLLKDGGSFYLMIPAGRFKEAILTCESLNLPVRKARIVFPKLSKNPKVVFLLCRRNLKGPLILEKPLIINTEEGNYTEEVKNILEGYL